MPSKRESEGALVRPSPVFATTHWSVVLAAGQHHSDAAATALEQLCRTYWYPLYAYVRRQGHSAHDAEDLTQAFFARFLEKRYLRAVDADPEATDHLTNKQSALTARRHEGHASVESPTLVP